MYEILNLNPQLQSFIGDIELRMDLYRSVKQRLLPQGGTLCDFANAYLYYGIHHLEDGWVYREWAPNAHQLYLEGDFNHWDVNAHVMKRLEGGIHDVRIDGTDPYGSGYVTLLSVTDRYGNEVSVKTSEKVRTALKFQSANFTVSYSAQAQVVGADGTVSTQKVGGYVDANGKYVEFDSFERYTLAGTDETFGADTIRFDGVGVGHGVGFSSNGSEQLAEQGYSYRYIIQFYFSGTEILNLYN